MSTSIFKDDYPQYKYIKRIFAFLGIIFLGAIGSGLWDIFLYDVFSFIVNIFLKTFSVLFNGYVDFLHKPIGKGIARDYFGELPFLLLVTTICISPWLSYFILMKLLRKREISITSENNDNEVLLTKTELLTKIKRMKKKLTYFLIPFGIFISLSYTLWGFEAFYVTRAIQFSERAIDILSPYISNEDILMLRSKYRSVDNADKFYEFENMIKKMAEERKITIPEFNSIKK